MISLPVQGFRFAVVGLLSNAALYVVYLGLTTVGLGHKAAMTLLYVLGTLQTFVLNRNWTFRHSGHIGTAAVRYALAYATGYVINLVVLLILVDRWGLPHEIVQGAMILFLAVFLFVLQRHWVFKTPVDLGAPEFRQ